MTPTPAVSAELPEALRQIAMQLESGYPPEAAAAKLRRLHAQVEALSAAQAGVPAEAPLPLLVRDIAADLNTTPIQVCKALAELGFGGHSVNMAVTPQMARCLRAHFATAPQPSPSPAPAQPGQEGERDYPPLPEPDLGMPWRVNAKSDGAAHSSGFTHTQMRAYVDADRAARAAPQPATDYDHGPQATTIEEAAHGITKGGQHGAE